MKFSLAHLTVIGCTPAEATRIAADAGYDFVSFRLIPIGLPNEPRYDLARDRAMFLETRTALTETGLALLDIEIARIIEGVNVDSYLPALEAAAALGAKHVITCGWSDDRSFVADSYARLCDLARPLGLTVDFEFISFANCSTLGQAVAVARESGRENAGVLVDSLHFDRSRATLEELDTVPPALLHFAHLRDAPKVDHPTAEEGMRIARGECLYLGEGNIAIKDMLRHMPEIPCSLEVSNTRRARELGYPQFARECLETAKRYFSTP